MTNKLLFNQKTSCKSSYPLKGQDFEASGEASSPKENFSNMKFLIFSFFGDSFGLVCIRIPNPDQDALIRFSLDPKH
jgi:hypothetical protein